MSIRRAPTASLSSISRLFGCIGLGAALVACAGAPRHAESATSSGSTGPSGRVPADEGALHLLQLDRDFSQLAAQAGMAEAVGRYYAPDAVSLPPEGEIQTGLEAVRKSLPPSPAFFSWEPRKAEIADSGDLGYTYGDFQLGSRSDGGTSFMKRGKYVSIWKKQADGTWKVAVGIGNGSPATPTAGAPK